MSEITSADLLQLLQKIEHRSHQYAVGLPKQKVQEYWEGVLFNITGLGVIAPLQEVREILNYPDGLTQVPGTQAWLLGMANIRGNLLPIIDLQQFLGGSPVVVGRRSRVLVVNHQGLYSGLLVGEVQGMRHFLAEQRTRVPILPEYIRQFVQGAYEYEGAVRPVFSMNLLAENTEFRVSSL
ncbi:chemotaxis protein CheW [Sedimenticola hydrogenitrophicus]|uniref:chemotaxis protein CheW n=1 Tax=Sedimenticola hydrogenitrophicus TaxID=2967975 RepID=UPI0021A56FD7|nr:chemotaxis protein CheW [Sedimenticola hydrogenitrophicus]